MTIGFYPFGRHAGSRFSRIGSFPAMTSRSANTYIDLVVLAGFAILAYELSRWSSQNWIYYLSYSALALLASGMNLTLPAVSGTVSINYLFVLIGISQLSLPETLAMGCLGVLVKCFLHWETRPRAIQIAVSHRSPRTRASPRVAM